jgi:lipoprotein-anchoring transpeptidase ErfK/SrfK
VALLEDGSAVTFFYGSVFRVIAAEPDDAGYLWYKVYDDKKNADPVYALARHLRRIDPRDLEPISPGANKRIEVDLAAQRITCFEDDQVVFATLTSSGGEGFGTPTGDHAIVYKQPSRHMYSDPEQEAFSDPNYFDLSGVPFNLFITTLGHAIHGTYWHGDFGRPRSHGCLNVTPEAARWLFRWVDPPSAYSAAATGSSADPGTPVRVF